MRNKRLDILRCAAVVSVILHHSGSSPFFTRIGWTGVDLFFVLSGFLISGLLFSEHKKRETIGFKRFFIRRGLKIYPAFYVFLLLTGVAGRIVFHAHAPFANYVHEAIFIMNYRHGVWDHTWSLAVEEHFYIFLPALLFLLARFSRNKADPFRLIPWSAASLTILCLTFRAGSVYVGKPNFQMAYIGSHERMDALFGGVLIGYLYHYRSSILERLMRSPRNCIVIMATSTLLLSSAYFFDRNDKFFATFGYTFIWFGFVGVLLLSLYVHGVLYGTPARVASAFGKVAAYVGMYSYSIYLWHGPIAAWLPGLMRRAIGFPRGNHGRFIVYFAGSLIAGIVMSKLIEYPILRIRDQVFPNLRRAEEAPVGEVHLFHRTDGDTAIPLEGGRSPQS